MKAKAVFRPAFNDSVVFIDIVHPPNHQIV